LLLALLAWCGPSLARSLMFGRFKAQNRCGGNQVLKTSGTKSLALFGLLSASQTILNEGMLEG
jgi:hypothetical protein